MARTKSLISVSDFITTRKTELRRMRDDLAQIESQKSWFATGAKICEEVAKIAKQHDAMQNLYVTPYIGYSYMELDVTFEVPCESLSTGVVPAVLEAAMATGFEPGETDDRLGDYSTTRVYRFKQTVGPLRINLRVRAEVKDGSESCRKVQVGTEVKEVPVYKLVCA